MNNPLIFTLLLLNTLLLITMSFWLVNKDCRECQQEKPLSRIFKNKCQSCQEANHEQ